MFTRRIHFQHPRRFIAAGVLVLIAAALVTAATLPRDEGNRTTTTIDRSRTSPTIGDDSIPSTEGREDGDLAEEGDFAAKATAPEGGASAGVAADSMTQDPENTTTIDQPTIEPRTAAPAIEPKLVRTATIAMRVEDGKFEDVWDDVRGVGDGARITIIDASRSDRGDSGSLGTMTLRVPSDRLDAIVDELRDVGNVKVERLDVSSDDVSDEYVDTKSRLRHDRAVERRLVTLLADTKNVSEVLAVQARLDGVQEQIEVSAGRIAYLDASTSTSTITLSLRERTAAVKKQEAKEDPSALAEAMDDAQERFVGNVADAIVWSGGALPILLLFAAIGIAARIVWTRVSRKPRAVAGPTDPTA